MFPTCCHYFKNPGILLELICNPVIKFDLLSDQSFYYKFVKLMVSDDYSVILLRRRIKIQSCIVKNLSII